MTQNNSVKNLWYEIMFLVLWISMWEITTNLIGLYTEPDQYLKRIYIFGFIFIMAVVVLCVIVFFT
jgi:hypothetical protein